MKLIDPTIQTTDPVTLECYINTTGELNSTAHIVTSKPTLLTCTTSQIQ